MNQLGWLDVTGCYKGRMLALEAKRPGNVPTKLQAAEIKKWRAAGAVSEVFTCVEDLREIIRRIDAGEL